MSDGDVQVAGSRLLRSDLNSGNWDVSSPTLSYVTSYFRAAGIILSVDAVICSSTYDDGTGKSDYLLIARGRRLRSEAQNFSFGGNRVDVDWQRPTGVSNSSAQRRPGYRTSMWLGLGPASLAVLRV